MTDPWPELESFLTAAKFWQIAEAETESDLVLYVPPTDVNRAQWFTEQAGVDRLVTVKPYPWQPANSWLLVDEQAMEVKYQEWLRELWTELSPWLSRPPWPSRRPLPPEHQDEWRPGT
jgi:hypothetical protein